MLICKFYGEEKRTKISIYGQNNNYSFDTQTSIGNCLSNPKQGHFLFAFGSKFIWILHINRLSCTFKKKFNFIWKQLVIPKMWSKEESSALISAIKIHVLKTFPITSSNNNHEFTGNLLDITNDWNHIANQLNRSGELLNDKFVECLQDINMFNGVYFQQLF